MLSVTLGRDARARAIQLPAWNEALGLPRPWDQQWSLRIQQLMAYETDLLEYPDIFEGSVVMDGLVAELITGARAEIEVVASQGGAVDAVEYMKGALVDSPRQRMRRSDSGEQTVVGLNSFTETEESPLMAGSDGGILTVDPALEAEQAEAVRAWRAQRDASAAEAAALRSSFGEYRAPTGVSGGASGSSDESLTELRGEVDRVSDALGRRIKILVGKPGLDGHSNGAEQIAVRARDAGMEVVYEGIRLSPEQIATSAMQEDVDVVGLSILSGSHRELIPAVINDMAKLGVDAPVVVGGIIPDADLPELKAAGVAGVYTPKDFEITSIIGDIVRLVAERNGINAAA